MANKKKELCPDCCTYTITINPINCNVLWEFQTKLKKEKRVNVSIENTINKIISEFAFYKEHQKK